MRPEISAAEWVTTQICVLLAAWRIKLDKAGSRSGCKLVSGSLSTIIEGGRGVNKAASQSR